MELTRSAREQGLLYERKQGRDTEDLKEKNGDTRFPSQLMPSSKNTPPDEQIKRLGVMFESVEEMLTSPYYDKQLKDELSAALPNYMPVFLTAKRDLLRNDCAIVVIGETSSGKTSLINELIGKQIFPVNKLATTSVITRIRDAENISVKCYLEDETLIKEEEVQDLKKLRSIMKKLTDLTKVPEDLKDIYYVDVYLPVSILKGNVIIVDTPGIGEDERLNKILLDFLPNAVSFVFVINANDTGGIHKDKFSKILKTILDNREKMPCFDPREVMFLANQWDIIKNEIPSSDEEDVGGSKRDDQHTQILKHINRLLNKGWGCLNPDNLFCISLEQVEQNVDTRFTEEYKRFKTVLKKTIQKNKNRRVEFYFSFLEDFVRHAERGTLARLNLLEMSEEEQQKIISQGNDKIKDLKNNCEKSRRELESYKKEIISKLAQKLRDYLESRNGREEILNPPNKTEICDVSYVTRPKEVSSRFQRGIQRWCEGQEVKSILKDADAKLKSLVQVIESKLQEIEFEMTGIDPKLVNRPSNVAIIKFSLKIFFLPLVIALNIFLILWFAPLTFDLFTGYFDDDFSSRNADNLYDKCLSKISMSKLKEHFEKSFGVEYSKVIAHLFVESLPKVIESMIITNKCLLEQKKAIKQKHDSFTKLRDKIKKIREATENFKKNC